LSWAAEGKSDWEIGAIIGISENTVHRHIEKAKSILGVRTRMQAVIAAWRRRWLNIH
jgi:DNA-binding CsgD family transcriptional regulator